MKLSNRLTITEVAEHLGVTPRTIMRWEKSGKIKRSKRDWRGWRFFYKEDLEKIKEFYESIYDFDELEMLVKKRTSKYNKDLYVTKCVICGAAAEDVHHIAHQSLANQAGFIGHFHQDHKHNLIPLCKEHHRAIHDGKIAVKGFVMTSTGLELEVEDQLNKPAPKVVDEPEVNTNSEEQSSSINMDDF